MLDNYERFEEAIVAMERGGIHLLRPVSINKDSGTKNFRTAAIKIEAYESLPTHVTATSDDGEQVQIPTEHIMALFGFYTAGAWKLLPQEASA